jgi:hypothetical protein
MVTGYPDYQRNINLAAQSADQLIQRPKYGAAQIMAGQDTIASGVLSTIASLTVRGIIYGGYISTQALVDASSSVITLIIDGVTVFLDSYENLNTRKIIDIYQDYLYLSKYSSIPYSYAVVFSPDTTFESSIIIKLKNNIAASMTYSFNFIYSTI